MTHSHTPRNGRLLELALAIPVRRVLAELDDRQVGRQVKITHALHEGERALEAGFVPVVEEEAADATCLVSVLEKEIAVAPFLATRVHVRAERLARGTRRAMPVKDVLVAWVIRRQVETAAEPPRRRLARRSRDDETHVGV